MGEGDKVTIRSTEGSVAPVLLLNMMLTLGQHGRRVEVSPLQLFSYGSVFCFILDFSSNSVMMVLLIVLLFLLL